MCNEVRWRRDPIRTLDPDIFVCYLFTILSCYWSVTKSSVPTWLEELMIYEGFWPIYSHLCPTALVPQMAFWQRMIKRFSFSHNRCHTTLLVQDGNACFLLPARITSVFLWYVRQNLWLDPKKADYLQYKHVPWAFSKANGKISARLW